MYLSFCIQQHVHTNLITSLCSLFAAWMHRFLTAEHLRAWLHQAVHKELPLQAGHCNNSITIPLMLQLFNTVTVHGHWISFSLSVLPLILYLWSKNESEPNKIKPQPLCPSDWTFSLVWKNSLHENETHNAAAAFTFKALNKRDERADNELQRCRGKWRTNCGRRFVLQLVSLSRKEKKNLRAWINNTKTRKYKSDVTLSFYCYTTDLFWILVTFSSALPPSQSSSSQRRLLQLSTRVTGNSWAALNLGSTASPPTLPHSSLTLLIKFLNWKKSLVKSKIKACRSVSKKITYI